MGQSQVVYEKHIISDNCCNGKEPAENPNPETCLPMIIPKDDPFYSRFGLTCLDLKRATNTHHRGCKVSPCSPVSSTKIPSGGGISFESVDCLACIIEKYWSDRKFTDLTTTASVTFAVEVDALEIEYVT